MEGKSKILLCGDVEGQFNALFNRVKNINKKAGPFDMLLCVGNFFGINNREFEPYKNKEMTVPVPTFILGPNKEEHLPLYCSNSNDEICPNIYYLGKRGMFTNRQGLKIAYLSGIGETGSSGDTTFSEKDITELYEACTRGNPSFRGIDILLTSQWPSGIMHDATEKVSLTVNACSELVSWVGVKLKPRYHVSGLEGIYYERHPFRCPSLGEHDTTLETVTRFIGLARVANPNKMKWIYALSLCPLDKMPISELLQKTTDETPCPYNFEEIDGKIFRTKRKAPSSNQYFYDMNTAQDDDKKKRTKKQKVEFDQSKCWFCLASPSVEKHLIITVGNHAYLALAKGGLVEEHFLICPIQHYQNTIALPDEVVEEISQYKKALQKFYARDGKLAVFFERNYKTSHMQLQVVPIPRDATRDLKDIFVEEAEDQGFKLDELDICNRLNQVVQSGVPYFTVELPDGTFLYTKIQGAVNFPLNFGREVLAMGPILNMPDRADWKECVLLREDEESLIQRLRTDFEPYDFTM